MTRYKSIIGALVLSALAICAFAAANASAKGLTAVECEEVPAGTGEFDNPHCVTTGKPGNYDTEEIVGTHLVSGTDTRTKTAEEGGGHGLGSTEKPVAVFHGVVGGVEVTVTCGEGKTTGGSLMNKELEGEMRIHVTGAVATWSQCHAAPRTKPLKTCSVRSHEPEDPTGSIKTVPLTSTTEANHKVVIQPVEGEVFTRFEITGGSTEGKCFLPLGTNATVTVTGKAWGRADTSTHSHLTLDEASNVGSPLKANGVAASQTETVTGFTTEAPEETVGATTFPEEQ